MIIYQIHRYELDCGEMHEYLEATYLNKQKALDKIEELKKIDNKELKQSKLCYDCPIYLNDKKKPTDIESYCKKADIYYDNEFLLYDCYNRTTSRGEFYYKLEEVEVIE